MEFWVAIFRGVLLSRRVIIQRLRYYYCITSCTIFQCNGMQVAIICYIYHFWFCFYRLHIWLCNDTSIDSSPPMSLLLHRACTQVEHQLSCPCGQDCVWGRGRYSRAWDSPEFSCRLEGHLHVREQHPFGELHNINQSCTCIYNSIQALPQMMKFSLAWSALIRRLLHN